MVEIIVARCADRNTPKGAWAEIATDGVSLASEVGFWTKVGTGVRVGQNSPLGNWSELGPYAVIGDNVKFGAWACVGIDALVESGATLNSHEYVPSGHYRKRNGETVNQIEPADAQTRQLYRAFDRYQTAIPAGAYDNRHYAMLESQKEEYRVEVARLLPEYLARREREPQARPALGSRPSVEAKAWAICAGIALAVLIALVLAQSAHATDAAPDDALADPTVLGEGTP